MDLNLDLAWVRVKNDLKDRNFVYPIGTVGIVESRLDEFFQILKARFDGSSYVPHGMKVVEVPKGKGLVRNGSLLELSDNIYYTCLVQECYSKILDRIKWAQKNVDFAYIASRNNINSGAWFQSRIVGWNNFRNASINLLNGEFEWVVSTDIAAFYDNIDIPTLLSDLRSCDIDNNIVHRLSICLYRWAQAHIEGKGIPQGNSASDLLAKLYLDTVDKGLKNKGFVHLRYVDDLRIFCKSKTEAKLALLELSRLLRRRGLFLQSAKTNIFSAVKARREFEGFQSIIQNINKSLNEELLEFLELQPYGQVDDNCNDVAPIEIIRQTIANHFIDGENDQFDKTLFHFLINQLINHKDDFALSYCLSVLSEHPEETDYILKYAKACNDIQTTCNDNRFKTTNELLSFLRSEDAVYEFQVFQILKWLGENSNENQEELLACCRLYGFDFNKPFYLRVTAVEILGRLGNAADLDRIQDQINIAECQSEKAALISCIRKSEKIKRNAFLGRMKDDGGIVKLAIDFVRSSR